MTLQGMKYDEAPTERYEEIFSGTWSVEQKFDGVRCMAHIGYGKVTFTTATGPLKFAAAAQWFDLLTEQLSPLIDSGASLVLDGELMIEDGTWWVFDLPYLHIKAGTVLPEDPYHVRRAALEELRHHTDAFRLVPVAYTESEKRAMWLAVNHGGQEGLVAKHPTGPYTVGRRSSEVLKMKIVHTIDCVVMERNEGDTCNAVLGLYDGDELTPVGRSSMIGREAIEEGAVVEVRFLTIRDPESPALLQPRVVRARQDKASTDCGMDQLIGKSSSKEPIMT